MTTPAVDRVLARIETGGDPDDPCWHFTGALTRGYGRVGLAPRGWGYAHRVVYEALVGPIPPGFVVDHLCHRPASCYPDGSEAALAGRQGWAESHCPHRRCVNPAHLEAVTEAENTDRGWIGLRWQEWRDLGRPGGFPQWLRERAAA